MVINGLSNIQGNKYHACFATNQYLGKQMDLKPRQIQQLLRELKEARVVRDVAPEGDPECKKHCRYLRTAWTRATFDERGGGCEKMRPDSSKKNDSSSDSNKPPYSPPTGDRLPDALNTERFRHWWDKWLVHRKEIKKTLTPTARETQLKKLEKMGEQQSIEAIEHSIASGYTGIFPPSGSNGNGAKLAGRYVEGPDGRTWRLGRDPGADSGLDFRERSILKSGYDPF